jgi:hypothetical protein
VSASSLPAAKRKCRNCITGDVVDQTLASRLSEYERPLAEAPPGRPMGLGEVPDAVRMWTSERLRTEDDAGQQPSREVGMQDYTAQQQQPLSKLDAAGPDLALPRESVGKAVALHRQATSHIPAILGALFGVGTQPGQGVQAQDRQMYPRTVEVVVNEQELPSMAEVVDLRQQVHAGSGDVERKVAVETPREAGSTAGGTASGGAGAAKAVLLPSAGVVQKILDASAEEDYRAVADIERIGDRVGRQAGRQTNGRTRSGADRKCVSCWEYERRTGAHSWCRNHSLLACTP